MERSAGTNAEELTQWGTGCGLFTCTWSPILFLGGHFFNVVLCHYFRSKISTKENVRSPNPKIFISKKNHTVECRSLNFHSQRQIKNSIQLPRYQLRPKIRYYTRCTKIITANKVNSIPLCFNALFFLKKRTIIYSKSDNRVLAN